MNKKIPSKYFIFILFITLICIVFPILILTTPAKAETAVKNNSSEVIAPALQYLREDYPAAFLSKNDYSIKLNTLKRYKLRCEEEINAVAIGDIENIKAEENKEAKEEKMLYELAAPKDIIVKTRQETYTYMQIYTSDEKPTTVMISINNKNEVPNLIKFGQCTMFEDIN